MRRSAALPAACLVLALTGTAARGQGPILAGAGPINRSMGGATVAAPLDPTGAMYWNPAAISGLPSSMLDLNMELLYPRSTIASTLPPGAAGPGLPPGPLAGQTRDEVGVFALPSGGLVYKQPCSPWSFGLGLFPAAGFGVNYPGSGTNPILTPQAPNGFGLGPVYSNYQLLQIAPTLAYQVTDRLSVGFAPMIDMARLEVNPGFFASPDDANRNGFATYPVTTNTRSAFGAGFQLGVYYVASDAWRFGASFRSPQWFEPFRFNSADELGRPRTVTTRFESPLIVSVGTAYTGVEKLTLAMDLRYFNFRDMGGMAPAGFDATGAITGLGWRDVFSVGLGAQYLLTDALSVRLGYTYNTPLIPGSAVTFNAASPLTYQHQVAVGATYRLTNALAVSATYYHIFYTAVSGPYSTPLGPLPGAAVSTGTTEDAVMIGVSVRF